MTVIQSLLAFAAAAALLTITPGVDTAMVLRTAVGEGPRRAALAATGIGLGCLVWGATVSLGLGALLAYSAFAFTALKWIGAAYLFWLGVRLILRPRGAVVAGQAEGPAGRGLGTLGKGFLTNALNPKVGVFYLTLLPQFVPIGVNAALFSFALACVHVLLGIVWSTVLIAATVPLGRVLTRPKVIGALDRMTGGIFIAFGVKLALSNRP